jgi:pyrroline-5-carboxylate reductase
MNKTIGFYGFGKMATSIVSAWKQSNPALDISFYRRNREKGKQSESHLNITYKKPSELLKNCDYLFLAIKPQQLSTVAQSISTVDLSSTTIVSLLAGTTIKSISQQIPTAKNIIRMMPNTSITYFEGVSGIYYPPTISDNEKQFVTQLMSSTGLTIEAKTEAVIDTITGLSGSAPAFIYTLANEILKLDKSYGLSSEERQKIVAQMLIGAGTALLKSGKEPQALIQEITSAKGTTEAGLKELEKRNFSLSYAEGTKASIKRAQELGEQS